MNKGGEMGLQIRSASFEPTTFNAEKRTVDVVFSTGAEVARFDLEGPYLERLSLEPSAVDLSELIGGPVLDNHDRFSGVRAILGVVEAAAADGKRGVATIRFSGRPEVQGIAADVQSGVIRTVSAGYSVSKWEVSKRTDGSRVKTAVRWTPKEISFTAIGADPNAKTRSNNMNEQLQEQIRSIATAVGVSATFADDLIQRNVTLEDARAAIIREAARAVPAIDGRGPAMANRDGSDNLVTRLADGLLSRMDPAHKPETGRPYAYHRIPDIARELLQARGLSTLGSPAELITRAMYSTTDFTHVLAEVFNKSLFSLRTSATPLQQVFRRTTIADFRARHILEISDGPALLKMAEGAQLTYGAITDKELASYQIDSYARGFAISFKALVNDDVQALSDLSAKMTRGARGWFAGLLAGTIIANPALADTKAIFHTDHGNLAGGGAVGAPSDTTIGYGKLAMRLQTDLTGNPVDVPARFLVIRATIEEAVNKLLATLYPTNSTEAETSARGLIPVVCPHFDLASHTGWYLFADPAVAPVFEYAELTGYEGPQVETRQGFDTLGTEVRVVWHVGAGAIDSRGGYKNPGA